jgi:V-type H+-transporting ATPase subunit a
MFGDLGHGMLMAIFAGWMVLREKPLAAKKSDSEVIVFVAVNHFIICLSTYNSYVTYGVIPPPTFKHKSLNPS